MSKSSRCLAWKRLFQNFYSPEDFLFYDYISSGDPLHRFDHLPSPEEIAVECPNACGYDSGMEDCMLNAGTILAALSVRKKNGGPDGRQAACRILNGIGRCTFEHNNPGFIVRGFSRGSSAGCYPNSSRDQFTLAVYGAWIFLRAYPEAPAASRDQARRILTAVAEFCRRRMTPENNWELGALDGGDALFSKMWECDPHEMLRLSMIYAAAFEATGNLCWKQEAERFLSHGIESSFPVNAYKLWDIALVQMQFSISLLRQSGLFPGYHEKLDQLLSLAGEGARAQLERLVNEAEKYSGTWTDLHADWHEGPFGVPIILRSMGVKILFRGKPFLTMSQKKSFQKMLMLLRGIGNFGIIMGLGGVPLDGALLRKRDAVLDASRFQENCFCCVVADILYSLELECKERGECVLEERT